MRTRYWLQVLFILLSLFFQTWQPVAASTNHQHQIFYQIPVDSTLSFDAVKSQKWSRSSDGWINENLFQTNYWLGESPKVAWVKIKISQPDNPLWLELASSGITRAKLYYLNQSKQIAILDSEKSNSHDSILVRSRFISFPVTQAMQQNDIYLRVEASAKLQLQLNIHQESKYLNQLIKSNFLYALGYGLLIVMILYNLVIGRFLRDGLYYIYSGAISSALLYQFFAHGHARIFFDLNWDDVNYGLNFLVMVTTSLSLYFLYKFSNIQHYSPKVATWLLLVFKIVGVITISTLFLPPNIALNIALIVAGPLPGLALVVSIWVWHCGSKEAGLFTLGWLFYIIGGLLWLLYWLGLVPLNQWIETPLIVGAALESIVLSLALGYRIQLLNEHANLLQVSKTHYKNLSLIDALSGVANRRAFDLEIERFEQDNKRFCLILFDLDYFKKFNDEYGHVAGDTVISQFGALLLNSIRDEDLAARIGGEEFAVITPKKSMKELESIAERIRLSFYKIPFQLNQETVFCSASVGIARRKQGEPVQSLVERTDKALYQAKENGRNQINVSD
jgi:two-component system, sensor histidine kinase LadS